MLSRRFNSNYLPSLISWNLLSKSTNKVDKGSEKYPAAAAKYGEVIIP